MRCVRDVSFSACRGEIRRDYGRLRFGKDHAFESFSFVGQQPTEVDLSGRQNFPISETGKFSSFAERIWVCLSRILICSTHFRLKD